MNQDTSKSIFAGIIGTGTMTISMLMAPNNGMREMTLWKILSVGMGVSVVVAWFLHFLIGILFALGYNCAFAPNFDIQSTWLKGATFGIAAVVLSLIGMKIIGEIFDIPRLEGSMPMRLTAMLIGHVVFGVVMAKTMEE